MTRSQPPQNESIPSGTETYLWFSLNDARRLLNDAREALKLSAGKAGSANPKTRKGHLESLQRIVILELLLGVGLRREEAQKITWSSVEEDKKIAFEGEVAGPAKPKGSYIFESVAGGTKVTALPRPELRGLFKLFEPMSNLKRLLEA